ncbi:hypothetical protein BACPU_22520 [Bacillus pumilus]|nr:hypothetical protein BACPU_22520 [Bacillus pumilus]
MDHPDSRHIESMSKDQFETSEKGDPDPAQSKGTGYLLNLGR